MLLGWAPLGFSFERPLGALSFFKTMLKHYSNLPLKWLAIKWSKNKIQWLFVMFTFQTKLKKTCFEGGNSALYWEMTNHRSHNSGWKFLFSMINYFSGKLLYTGFIRRPHRGRAARGVSRVHARTSGRCCRRLLSGRNRTLLNHGKTPLVNLHRNPTNNQLQYP